MDRILSLLSSLFRYVLVPLSGSWDSGPHRCRPKLAQQEAGRRIRAGIVLAAVLLAGLLMREAQAGPTIQLTYYGDVEGVLSAAVLTFEDNRLPAGSTNWGFYYSSDGKLCWKRVAQVDGYMHVGGYITNLTYSEGLSVGTFVGLNNWAFPDIILSGGGSIHGRLDLEWDAKYIYIDKFGLKPEPEVPENTSYYIFQLEAVATPTITPNGGNFSGPVQVTLACATMNATVFYTTDGTSPVTSSSSAVYSGPFTLAASATVKALGVRVGLTDISTVASATFTVTPSAPLLTVTRSGNSITVSWPSPSPGFVLQQNNNVANTNGWTNYGTVPSDNGTTKSVTFNIPTGNLFFRLKQ